MVGNIRVSNFHSFGIPRIISKCKKMPNYGISKVDPLYLMLPGDVSKGLAKWDILH